MNSCQTLLAELYNEAEQDLTNFTISDAAMLEKVEYIYILDIISDNV